MYLFVITGMMPNKDAADIPLEFNKTEQEPANIFPQKLLDSEYTPPLHCMNMRWKRTAVSMIFFNILLQETRRIKVNRISVIGYLKTTTVKKKEAESRQRGMNGVPDMPAIFYRRKINYSIAVPVPIHIFIFPKAATYI